MKEFDFLYPKSSAPEASLYHGDKFEVIADVLSVVEAELFLVTEFVIWKVCYSAKLME